MRKILILFFLFFNSPVYAGMYLEPYAGFAVGDLNGNITDTSDNITELKYDVAGGLYGGKVGFSYLLLTLGADYMAGKLHSDGEFNNLKDRAYFKTSSVGAFLQVELPVLMKASATYFFSTKYEHNYEATTYKYKGSGTKIGIGLTPLPFISVNIDFVTQKLDKSDTEGYPEADLEVDHILVGVSVPIDI